MIKKTLGILITVMLIQSLAFASDDTDLTQSTNFIFNSLTLGDGLSNGTIYTIGQDKRGVMWFGTDDKLNMYNGISFMNFENDPDNSNSIASNSASNIFVDKDDNIWIGTWGDGLDKYDYNQNTFTHYSNSLVDPNSLSDNRVQTVFQDSSGTIWAGTYAGGLNKLVDHSGKFERFVHDPQDKNSISDNRVWGICEVEGGNLIIATSNGLNHLDVKSGTFEHYKNQDNNEWSIASSRTRAVHKSSDNEVWVATESGISLFNVKTRKFLNFDLGIDKYGMKSSVVNTMLLDSQGTLWVGAIDGLLQFNTNSMEFTQYYNHSEQDLSSLANNNVRSLYQDRSGLIWVGTRGGGLSIFNPNITFSYINNESDNNATRTLALDKDGRLFIGRNDGLFQFNPITGQSDFISPERPNAISIDSSNTIWAGFDSGLVYKFDHDTYSSKLLDIPFLDFDAPVIGLLQDHDDLWIATYGSGLYLVDTKSETLKKVFTHDQSDISSISGNEIWSIQKDSTGRLWFGTQNGISLFNRETESFSSINANFAYSIYEDMTGTMWIGSREGLLSFTVDNASDLNDSSIETIRYNQKDGLSSNMIYGVRGDNNGIIWLSTEYGISKFNPEDSSFKNYNKKNGLKYEKFVPRASVQANDGEIHFGSINGVVSFSPDQIIESKVIPNVIITDIAINGISIESKQSIDQIDKLELSYKDVLFSFEFSALDFKDFNGNQYAYMLEGFDTNWIFAKNRTYVSYTSIPPGEYDFRVKASNSDGYWNEEGVKVKVIIAPPWWNTTAIKVLGALTILTVIIGGYYFRITALKKRNLILEKMVDERTKELAILNDELVKLASIDGLTQLKNRRYADIHLDTEWKRALREHVSLSILLIDIDYFKAYNDMYGHPQGDQCLKAFANVLKKTTKRSSDIACRYGGEEFLLILPNTHSSGAVTIAEAILADIRALEIPHEQSSISEIVTCSIGVASITPENDQEIADLIKSADTALYKAKNNGRNQIVMADPVIPANE